MCAVCYLILNGMQALQVMQASLYWSLKSKQWKEVHSHCNDRKYVHCWMHPCKWTQLCMIASVHLHEFMFCSPSSRLSHWQQFFIPPLLETEWSLTSMLAGVSSIMSVSLVVIGIYVCVWAAVFSPVLTAQLKLTDGIISHGEIKAEYRKLERV